MLLLQMMYRATKSFHKMVIVAVLVTLSESVFMSSFCIILHTQGFIKALTWEIDRIDAPRCSHGSVPLSLVEITVTRIETTSTETPSRTIYIARKLLVAVASRLSGTYYKLQLYLDEEVHIKSFKNFL